MTKTCNLIGHLFLRQEGNTRKYNLWKIPKYKEFSLDMGHLHKKEQLAKCKDIGTSSGLGFAKKKKKKKHKILI